MEVIQLNQFHPAKGGSSYHKFLEKSIWCVKTLKNLNKNTLISHRNPLSTDIPHNRTSDISVEFSDGSSAPLSPSFARFFRGFWLNIHLHIFLSYLYLSCNNEIYKKYYSSCFNFMIRWTIKLHSQVRLSVQMAKTEQNHLTDSSIIFDSVPCFNLIDPFRSRTV